MVTGPAWPAAEAPKLRDLRAALTITGDQMVARGYADVLERTG